MTIPPLPDTPCVRVRMDFTQADGFTGGIRFFESYSGSAPTAGDCTTLAGDIATAYATNVLNWVNDDWSLTEIDVLDIASDSGLSGQWTGTETGGRSGTPLPAQVATNVEFNIARRYRGGKPRMFWPPSVTGDLANPSNYDGTFLAGIGSATSAFFATIAGLSIGAMGTLAHVNLSYYSGYETTSPPWRGPGYKYPPKYRALAKSDVIEGYAPKAMLGSQKRRRSATTP